MGKFAIITFETSEEAILEKFVLCYKRGIFRSFL